MMLFGIRRLAAAQASARMLPRSLRTHATQSEKRGRPHGWRGSTELQRTDASTTHLAERLLLGRQLLLWLGLHLRGVLHEHGLVHQILYEGAARGRQLLCGTRDAPSVGPPGLGRCSTRARSGGKSKAPQNNGMYLVRAGAHRPGGKGTPPWYFSTPYSIWQPALLRLMLSSRRPVSATTHLVVSRPAPLLYLLWVAICNYSAYCE